MKTKCHTEYLSSRQAVSYYPSLGDQTDQSAMTLLVKDDFNGCRSGLNFPELQTVTVSYRKSNNEVQAKLAGRVESFSDPPHSVTSNIHKLVLSLINTPQ